ncbi:ATP-binding protein [Hyphomicrobium sp. CS1GBMeth3]|uniref:ATP-binding protein n=1 Tax=Hyphomicrobium sp. CS1GBMeth3 TaxID=1892845 RepID=UPI0015C5347E|nr:ATP-binding protein [Hyphomicrobium sp. CS1GBMeth3]
MTDPRPLVRSLSAPRSSVERVLAQFRALRRRLRERARALALVAIVFTVLWFAGGLSGALALTSFLLMAMVVAGREPAESDGEKERSPDVEPRRRGGSGGGNDREGESWRLIVDAVPDATVALDHNFNIIHFNARLEELFPNIRVGQPLSQLSRHPELNAAVERAVTANQQVVVDLYERVPVERRLSATISRIGGREIRRGLPFLIACFRDLTEQDKLAQMRADFIANASHELRTPLASLRGFVETLQGPARDDPEARARFLAIMSSQANRMTRLIDDLLSLSRAEMRVHLPPRGIVDLNEVASYVAQALDPVAASSKAKIAVTKAEGPVRIRGDRDEIVQVLQNLVHNAIKYGREGGRIEIAISRVLDGSPPRPRVLLAVADDGQGIAPEHLPRLTERFYRANAQASREKGGTGLGLAIVKHIVLRHRGELRISSTLGKGSTFSILFDEVGNRS